MNSFKTNNGNNCLTAAPKTKKRKEEADEDLYADDYFGRMVASLMKTIDPAKRMQIRLRILQLIDDCTKTNENNKWSSESDQSSAHESIWKGGS